MRCACVFPDYPCSSLDWRQARPPKEREMTPESFALMTPKRSDAASLQDQLDRVIDDLLASLPNPDHFSPAERRGIIARYTAVLEGNFIYWMTAANLAVASKDAAKVRHRRARRADGFGRACDLSTFGGRPPVRGATVGGEDRAYDGLL